MTKAEAAYAAGRLTNPEIAAMDALAWADHTEREIDDRLTQLPLVDGIAETVQWCRAHRLLPVPATLAWQPIACAAIGDSRSDLPCSTKSASVSLSTRTGRRVTGPRRRWTAGTYGP
jgi:phosphoserine phosphatase